MAEDFYLDAAGLRGDTEKLRAGGNRLTSALTELNGVLDQHDGCWGDDDIGKSFAKNYVDSAKDGRKYGKDAADGIVETADNVDESSETFQSMDQENARAVDRQNA